MRYISRCWLEKYSEIHFVGKSNCKPLRCPTFVNKKKNYMRWTFHLFVWASPHGGGEGLERHLRWYFNVSRETLPPARTRGGPVEGFVSTYSLCPQTGHQRVRGHLWVTCPVKCIRNRNPGDQLPIFRGSFPPHSLLNRPPHPAPKAPPVLACL